MLSENVQAYIEAGASGILIQSYEEERVLTELASLLDDRRKHYRWSATHHLYDGKTRELKSDPRKGFVGAMQTLLEDDPTLTLMFDPYRYIKEHEDNLANIRAVREVLLAKKGPLIMLSPEGKLGTELDKYVFPVEFSLPKEEELFQHVVKGSGIPRGDQKRVAESLIGLTMFEASVHLKLMLNQYDRDINKVIQEIWKQKARLWKTHGIDEVGRPSGDIESVGGLYKVKSWLKDIQGVFSKEARTAGVPSPRGLLLAGPPGCGKSLLCKVVASMIGYNFARVNITGTLDMFVGNSESRMRSLLATLDALRPVVALFDEFAHQTSGFDSPGDPGVMSHIDGMMLQWLEDRQDGVLVCATTNEPWRLPMHMLRNGRFEPPWYVDFPQADALEEILAIHLKAYGLGDMMEESFNLLNDATKYMQTEKFVGADVEQAIRTSVQYAYPKKPTFKEVVARIKETNPSVHSMEQEKLNRLEMWRSKARLAA